MKIVRLGLVYIYVYMTIYVYVSVFDWNVIVEAFEVS